MARHRRLWSVVRKIILDNYESFKDEYLRDVFYMIGDMLGEKLKAGEITQEDYDWYNSKQGAATLRDDVWTDIEQKYGLERPKAWTYGIVFQNGVELSLDSLRENMERGIDYIWEQARGFIFVEKGGVAKKLKILSEYGWTVFSGKGYPERLLRKLLKEEDKKRPVLVIHDWDRDGEGILAAMQFQTKRTKHLNIALKERVTDLGLTEKIVKQLELPTRPSPPKYKGRPRVEISALAVLKRRMGIENPILAYTVAMMITKGIMVSPLEIEKKRLLELHLRWLLTKGLGKVVNEVIEEVVESFEGEEILEGSAVEGVIDKIALIAPEVHEALVKTAENLIEALDWQSEEFWHQRAVGKFSDERLVEILKNMRVE